MKYAAKVYSPNGSEWIFCVSHSKKACKKQFCEWYANVSYEDICVKYIEVEVTEKLR